MNQNQLPGKSTKPEQNPLQSWVLAQTPPTWQMLVTPLERLVQGFEPISLMQMEAVALLNRTDTKFIMTQENLLTALTALQQDYWMLAVKDRRLNHYRTLYFDLPDFDLYRMNVNGRANRYKVRSREYTDSGLSFLEVKHKTSKGRTIKDRMQTQNPVIEMNSAFGTWLQEIFPVNYCCLESKLWNTFTRLTLVNKLYPERVTLDVDLAFQANHRAIYLGGLVIAELKMDVCNERSPFWEQMRAQHIHPRGFSKYCIGVAMTYEHVKKNSLKPKLRWIDKLTQGKAA